MAVAEVAVWCCHWRGQPPCQPAGTYGAGMELGSHFSGALVSHFFLGSPLFAHWHRVVGHSGAWFFQFSTSQLFTHLVKS